MINETWVCIEGFEESYMVSDHGRVKSVARVVMCGKGYSIKREMPNLVMKQMAHYKGYRYVFLHRPGKKTKVFIHRLVATAFLPNPERLPIVDHKNEDKTHNHVSNLEWVTGSDNTQRYYERQKKENESF